MRAELLNIVFKVIRNINNGYSKQRRLKKYDLNLFPLLIVTFFASVGISVWDVVLHLFQGLNEAIKIWKNIFFF